MNFAIPGFAAHSIAKWFALHDKMNIQHGDI